MTRLACDRYVKLVCAVFDQRIDRMHDFGKVHRRSSCIAGADHAVKVQKIRAFRQGFGAFTFDVLANVVFAGIQQAVAVFAFGVKRVGFFQTGLSYFKF